MTLKSLVTIRMNEIFPVLACCGQKLNFLCSVIETKINTSTVKQSSEDKIGTIILKSDTYDAF